MIKRALLVVAMVVARTASAETLVPIETHGVEIQVPSDWSNEEHDGKTILAPKKYKGRAIEVVSLPAMPANKDELQKLLGAKETVTIVKAGPIDRAGAKVIIAIAKAKTAKLEMDVDMIILPVDKGATMVMSFIRGDQDPLLRKANDAILDSAHLSGPKMSVEVTPTKTKGAGASDAFVKYLNHAVPGLDRVFLFPRPLPVRVLDCGAVNAFYSPVAHDIKICHELFDSLRALFKGSGADEKRAEEMTYNTIKFAFLHEFGHALVGEFGLPITGKGEDAADEIATLLILGSGKEGQQVALDAAEWFEISVKATHGKVSMRTFFDEHSYDEARVGNIYCMLYGSDKVTYADLMKKRGMPARRLQFCLKDYPDRHKSWDTLLAPHHRAKLKN